MLEKYKLALEDAITSVKMDENFTKGYLRAAKCYLMLGNPSLSIDWYDKVLLLQPHNPQAAEEVRHQHSLILVSQYTHSL